MSGPGPRAVKRACARMLAAAQDLAVLDAAWGAALAAAPRHLFLPDRVWIAAASGDGDYEPVERGSDPAAWFAAAYGPGPVVTQIEDGGPEPLSEHWVTPTSSVSAPAIVLAMLYDLDVRPGQRILEIGTGAGWNAALLAHRAGPENVTTIEIDPGLAATARGNLARVGLRARVLDGDGAVGDPHGAPYDRIIATAAVGAIPRAWIGQSRPGTVIVAPWLAGNGFQAVARLTVGADAVASGRFTGGSSFMPLRADRLATVRHAAYVPAGLPGTARTSTSALDPATLFAYARHAAGFALGLVVPGFHYATAADAGGAALWLYSMTDASWAYAYRAHGEARAVVHQDGPRPLWDQIEAAHAWWQRMGAPEATRFGLTVDQDGERLWLDRADYPLPVFAAPDPAHGSLS